jgi:uncharacterized sporulation protein YeaH/YhbH (DUF444 family)
MHIIDRRLNPGGKSLANRQRFLRRAKALVQRAVRESFKDRSIKDLDRGGEISIVRDGVHEPTLHGSGTGGNRDYVLPGNKKYVEGDTIPRPTGGGSGGAGPDGGLGSAEDEFRFILTKEEYLSLFLDDLELPDLAKRRLTSTESQGQHRAGYTTSGSPANLSVIRTMRNSLSRRIALKRPRPEEIAEIEEQIAKLELLGDAEAENLAALRKERDRLVTRSRRVSYIDPIDLRYRRNEPTPKPVAQAVMFCLMDVSGSMTEHMKDLAKRFYALLHLFLTRYYRHVDIVFIRHTDLAEEVDEETFFYSQETGGTMVSTALEEMLSIVEKRYNPNEWNIYVAQASDGDNMQYDNPKAASLMADSIIPLSQYVAYLEVGREEDPMPSGSVPRRSDLWQTYEAIAQTQGRLAMRKVWHRRDIYPVFRELFHRREARQTGTQG